MTLRIVCFWILLAACATVARAQEFPTKTVTLVVPFQAGGATDVLARLLQTPMGKALGQSVVVENKPGADTLIGARYVAAAAPDGYHAIILSSSGVSWPYFVKDPGVDLINDFAPAGSLVEGSLIIGASSKAPFSTFKEMIDYAKANPGKVTWSLSSRAGETLMYLYLLQAKAGVSMLEVVYKGSAPQAQAVIAGEVDIGQFAPGRALAMEKGGQFKPLAISGDKRDRQFPNVPTMKELGYDRATNYAFGLFLPAKTPASTVGRWNDAAVRALKDATVLEGLAKFGFYPTATSPSAHALELRQAKESWAIVNEIAKFKPE